MSLHTLGRLVCCPSTKTGGWKLSGSKTKELQESGKCWEERYISEFSSMDASIHRFFDHAERRCQYEPDPGDAPTIAKKWAFMPLNITLSEYKHKDTPHQEYFQFRSSQSQRDNLQSNRFISGVKSVFVELSNLLTRTRSPFIHSLCSSRNPKPSRKTCISK